VSEPARPDLSVVIPTRDRPADLARCLAALDEQTAVPDIEIVVVDDGSSPPLTEADAPSRHRVRIVRGRGAGPAAARNLGAGAARSDVLLFTDDDTLPAAGWCSAALAYLQAHPDALGVEGPVTTRPFDVLYEYSIEGSGGGHYWTCNIAYRREAFEAVGGFDGDAFPYAHAEDRDLGLRVARNGPIGYAAAMAVEHVPRRFTLRRVFRQALWTQSDLVLEQRHPEHFTWPNRVPSRVRPVVGTVRTIAAYVASDWRAVVRSPRRTARTILVAGAGLAGSITAAVTYRPPRRS
jgi:GT2 family glycosyltransferase